MLLRLALQDTAGAKADQLPDEETESRRGIESFDLIGEQPHKFCTMISYEILDRNFLKSKWNLIGSASVPPQHGKLLPENDLKYMNIWRILVLEVSTGIYYFLYAI